jgi:hypothetical protein
MLRADPGWLIAGEAVNKFVETVLIVIVGLAALIAAGPTITRLVQALVPLVLVVGVVVAVLQLVRYFTRS